MSEVRQQPGNCGGDEVQTLRAAKLSGSQERMNQGKYATG
jgi:hypothetical protein